MKDLPNIMQENKLLKGCLCSEKLSQGCAVILKGVFSSAFVFWLI